MENMLTVNVHIVLRSKPRGVSGQPRQPAATSAAADT